MKVRLLYLAGVATSTDFLDPLREQLLNRYAMTGIEADEQVFMPYGDWSRSVVVQLNEVRRDLWNKRGPSLRTSLPRGHADQIASAIPSSYSDCPLILIGHSAGGNAGVRIAWLLQQRGIEVARIVQVGSPKFAIPPNLRDKVLYMYAVNRKGRIADPIVRLGTWGGWQRSRQGLPVWNRRLNAPSTVRAMELIGGHADYFRAREPFCNPEGRSNLSLTSEVIWNFINGINET